MANDKVRQMHSTTTGLDYDIQAPELVPENEYVAKQLNLVNSDGSVFLTFNKTSENVGGQIEYNTKGNLSIESLTKHVNIEAKKGIQLKPTTNIIFDSSRRILNGKGNEVHLEFVYDDYDETSTGHYDGDDEPYAQLKIEARSIDLRCFDHGGVAIQPCGSDGAGHENKIKFESSRTSPIGTDPRYSTEGGQGLEFGTFNNEHSSLFTGDYRFNKDGVVYAVTREFPQLDAKGKYDYPTQNDDFKDVIDNNTPSASWENIIKTATVFANLANVTNPTTQDLLDAFNNVFHPQAIPE